MSAIGKALVTGATGFVGRHLCTRLQQQGVRVTAMGRHACDGPWDAFVACDLAAAGSAPTLPAVDVIYHLASKAHALSERPGATDGYDAVIIEGTRRLIAAARQSGCERFVYISSVKAIGEGQGDARPVAAIDESAPCAPTTPYGVAKLRAEQLVRGAGFAHWVILRPTMVYGPGQKGNLVRMAQAVRRNRFPPLPETGNRRSMVHVDDLVEAMLAAGHCPQASGYALIISGAEAPSTRQLYDAIRSALGMPEQDVAIPLWMLRAAAAAGTCLGYLLRRRMPLDKDTLSKLTGSAWYSSSKAGELLGYQPRQSLNSYLATLSFSNCQREEGRHGPRK
jgi:nucleoside-diphosphate-sugar epimerase